MESAAAPSDEQGRLATAHLGYLKQKRIDRNGFDPEGKR